MSLLVRGSSISWNQIPSSDPRSLWQRTRRPDSPLGAGLKTRFCANAPFMFYYLPQRARVDMVRGSRRREALLGPAGAWWLRERVLGRVQILLGQSVLGATTRGGAVLQSVDRMEDHAISPPTMSSLRQAIDLPPIRCRSSIRPYCAICVASNSFPCCLPASSLQSRVSISPGSRAPTIPGR